MMKYEIKLKKSKNIFIALHGTGGNEMDLINLVQEIHNDSIYIGLRGNVIENGMNRFFKRISFGVFDESNIRDETKKILKFLEHLESKYNLYDKNWNLIGYSNGANMASSLIFHSPKFFKKAFLFNPMKPFKKFDYPDLSNVKVFISSGQNDPIVKESETMELIDLYKSLNTRLKIVWTNHGHKIPYNSILKAKKWFVDEN